MLSILALATNHVSDKNYFLPLRDNLSPLMIQTVLKDRRGEKNIITTPKLLPLLKETVESANFYIFSQRQCEDKENNITYFNDNSFINNAIVSQKDYLVIVDHELYKLFVPYCLTIYMVKIDSNFYGTKKQLVPDFSNLNYSTVHIYKNNLNLQIHSSLFNKKTCEKQKLFSAYSDCSCFLQCNMECPYC